MSSIVALSNIYNVHGTETEESILIQYIDLGDGT